MPSLFETRHHEKERIGIAIHCPHLWRWLSGTPACHFVDGRHRLLWRAIEHSYAVTGECSDAIVATLLRDQRPDIADELLELLDDIAASHFSHERFAAPFEPTPNLPMAYNETLRLLNHVTDSVRMGCPLSEVRDNAAELLRTIQEVCND